MKIYNPKPVEIIRLKIDKQGEESYYINLIDCTQQEVIEFVKKIIVAQNTSPFEVGKKTTIQVRESIRGKNGNAKSVAFRGLSTKDTYYLLINSFQ